MGPADKQPPFPDFPWTKLPKKHRYVTKFRLECNYLQAMEGDYDPTHARFLHSTFMPAERDVRHRRRAPTTARPRTAASEQHQPGRALPEGRRRPPHHRPTTRPIRSSRTTTPPCSRSRRWSRRRQRHGQRRRDVVDARLLHRRQRHAGPPLQQHARADRQREPHVLPPALELEPDLRRRPCRVQARRLDPPGDDPRHAGRPRTTSSTTTTSTAWRSATCPTRASRPSRCRTSP